MEPIRSFIFNRAHCFLRFHGETGNAFQRFTVDVPMNVKGGIELRYYFVYNWCGSGMGVECIEQVTRIDSLLRELVDDVFVSRCLYGNLPKPTGVSCA